MKKTLTTAIAVLTISTVGITALANDNVNVVVNGEPINFTGDQAPIIQNDRTLVPFRAVFEKMGASVNWFEDIQLCEATYGSITVSLTIGNNVMRIGDGTTVEVDVPAQIINDRTMVPIRVISEGIGAVVGWEEDTRTVTVNTPTLSESFPEMVSTIVASSGVTNEKTGTVITFDYPVITDEYTAVNKLNDTILSDIISAAQNTVDNYIGDLTEINISFYVRNVGDGLFEVNYIINREQLLYTATYSIATGSKIDEDFLMNLYGNTSNTYEIYTYFADKSDENGNPYITAYAEYPQFTDDSEIISSLNTQLENSAKKAVDSYIASYSEEASLNAGETYSFSAYCNVKISNENIAVITTKHIEISNKDKKQNTDSITVNLITGEIME